MSGSTPALQPAPPAGTVAQPSEVAAGMLRVLGLRVTKPRLAVLTQVIRAGADHLSAEEVVERVSGPDAQAHRATVYRTLEGLTDAGVLAHVHLDRGKTAYHLADVGGGSQVAPDGTGHLHAQCARCHRVVDLPADSLHCAVEGIRAATGFTVDPGHVALSGLCRGCASLPADASSGDHAVRGAL